MGNLFKKQQSLFDLSRFKNWNWQLIALIFLLVVIDFRNWSDTVWPANDGMSAAQSFYVFYNEFFFHGHLIRWMPYGNFGIQADLWQSFSLSPANYLMGLIGVCLRIPNAFLLFKLSIFLEQLFLLLGTYLLSREIYRHKSAAFFVCLGVMASTVWISQLYWNFRIYYLLPMALYFLILFFKREQAFWLWLSGTVCMIALIGNATYYISLYFFMMVVFAAVLCFWKQPFRCLIEKSPSNILSFLLFLFVAGVICYFSLHMLDYTISNNEGRDPVTHKSTVEGFLSHGPDLGLKKYLGLFFAVVNQSSHHTLYVGVLSLVFLLYALITVRKIIFAAIGTMILLLFCLSLSDTSVVARHLFDFFPLMHYFRSIGVLGGILRLFLILAAGFGLDHFLDCLKQRNKESENTAIKYLNGCGLILLVLFLFLDSKNNAGDLFENPRPEFGYFAWITAGIAILMLNRFSVSSRFASRVIVFFFALGMLSYQNLASSHWEFKFPWVESQVTQVHPYTYQSARFLGYPDDQRFKAIQKVMDAGNERLAVEMFSYFQIDPCLPREYPNFYWNQGVDQLIDMRWPLFKFAPSATYFLSQEKTPDFMDLVGCSSYKIKFYDSVLPAENSEAALELIKAVPELSKAVIVEGVSKESFVPVNPKILFQGSLKVESFDFNSLVLNIDVNSTQSGWLFYADAYHPGWQATINGKETPVYRANLAFKAIQIQPGQQQTIRFSYFDGLRGVASYSIAVLGLIFAVGMLVLIGFVITNRFSFPAREI